MGSVAAVVGGSHGFRQRLVHRKSHRLFNCIVECNDVGARLGRPPDNVARLLDRMGARGGVPVAQRMVAMASRRACRLECSLYRHGSIHSHFDLQLSSRCLACLADRPLETRAMKHMRITTAHQSFTFSRRMMLLGGAQAAVGGLLIGRMGYLSIAQNEKYQLLSES